MSTIVACVAIGAAIYSLFLLLMLAIGRSGAEEDARITEWLDEWYAENYAGTDCVVCDGLGCEHCPRVLS